MLSRIGRGVRTLAGYVSDGALARLTRRSVALAVSPHAVAFTPVIGIAAVSSLPLPQAALIGGALFGLSAVLLWRLKMILAADLFAYMRVLAQGTGREAEAYDARLNALAGQIAAESDETLIVGHSLGGMAAIRATASLLEHLPPDGRISLMTLGSVHGIVLAQKGAGRDRLADAIAAVCSDPRVFWLDVSSPRDAFCVPLTDPLLLIGDRVRPGMTSPRVISARLANAPRIPGDRRTVFAAMRRHMGYLLTPEAGSGFDYADTVTGRQTLAERFGPRGNSPKARMWHG